jgi:hypothetical protein
MIYKFQGQILQNYVLLYHIIGFITSSVVLILVYLIVRKLFSDFDCSSELYPFLIAAVYCVLFNKDEIYPWAVFAFASYSLFYLVSFYTYINKEKKHYLWYSLVAYTLGLFTYESGIALPLIFLSYDVLRKKDYKLSFLFGVPLIFNLLVRLTSWFGIGSKEYTTWGNDVSNLISWDILHNIIDFVSVSVFTIFRQILYAINGFEAIGLIIIGVISLDVVLLYILFKFNIPKQLPQIRNFPLIVISIIIIAAFAAPFIIRGNLLSGGLPTRSFEFIDIGFAMLVVLAIGYFSTMKVRQILIMVLIGASILLCQGLCMNWVVSGNIQNDIYNYIGQHSVEINGYDYVYFNTTSFILGKPNAIDESIFYPIARLYNPQIINQRLIANDSEYDRYYNAKCLDNYALLAMLTMEVNPKYNYQNLIYGNTTVIPAYKSQIFEINYSGVYASI